MQDIEVSIILPFRNAAKTISKAIESILNQSFEKFELILIDDGSDDHSVRIASSNPDPRIQLIRLQQAGIVEALNNGISASRGKYIARMDADDYSYPERLLLQYRYLEKNQEVGVVSGLVQYVGDRKKNLGYALYVDWINTLRTFKDIYLNRFVESPLSHPSVMMRKDLFDKHGLYRAGNIPEDYELWLRLLDNHVRFAKVNKVVLDWYDDENRLSRIHANYSVDTFFKIKTEYFAKWYFKFFKSNPPAILIWGTGKSVRQKSRYLEDHELEIAGYIDVIDRKGHKIKGKPVYYYKEIPKNVFILSYVSDRKGREQIHDFLLKNNFNEGQDFYMMN
jgi:glycosyltransferase involved in cell wall biosynthesis